MCLRIPVKITITDSQLINSGSYKQSHKRHSRENSSRKMIEINLGFFIQRREVLVEYTKMQFLINYHAFID